ncbi:triadin-like [Loxodonta africana]|uniref:triadin-like n=1 Tax=Loxodonta africana TaxID=9785 RepID=UPI0030D2FAE8
MLKKLKVACFKKYLAVSEHFCLELLFKPYLCFAAVPGKKEEKTTKAVEQEIRKEKYGKTSSVLKDKEPVKAKEVKIPEVPASLKEKGF